MKHADRVAAWMCPECEAQLCEACVSKGAGARSCPFCGGRLRQPDMRDIRAQQALQQEDRDMRRVAHSVGGTGSAAEFLSVVAYPFRGKGRWILVGGTLIYMLAGIFRCVPIISMLVAAGISGYAVSYLMRIIGTSAGGDDDPPDWPDFSNFYEGIVVPLFRWTACLVISFLPLILVTVYHIFYVGSAPNPTVMIVLLIWAALYMPMALLSVTLWESVSAAGPQKVLPAIARIGISYLLVVILLAAILVTFFFLRDAIDTVLRTPMPKTSLPVVTLIVLGAITLACFSTLYLLMVVGRAIGLLYHVYGKRLKWFE